MSQHLLPTPVKTAMQYTVPDDASERLWFQGAEFPISCNVHSVLGPEEPDRCYHKEFEFMFFLSGHCSQFVKDGIYECRKNSVLIVHADEVHNFIPTSPISFESFNIVMSPRLLAGRSEGQALLELLATSYHVMLSEKEMTTVELSLHEMKKEIEAGSIHWQSMVCSNLERILVMLVRAAARGATLPPVENDFSREIVSYLEEHYSSRVTLQSAAQDLNYSPWALSRLVKKHVGMGFQEYLIHRRVIAARKLLDESDLKIALVARKVGFTDLSTFNRDFKLVTGLTPSSYRKLAE